MMSFKPNRELLNCSFTGYKLSDQPLISRQENFVGNVHKISHAHPESLFSFEHTRQAKMKNHLTPDPWNKDNVYWKTMNTQSILCGSINMSGNLVIVPVHHGNQPSSDTPTTNPSLIFLSETHALFYEPSYSQCCCLILFTGDRSTPNEWDTIGRLPLTPPNITILNATLSDEAIDFMTFELEATPTKHCNCVWWRARLSGPLGPGNIEIIDQTQLWQFKSSSVPLYCEYMEESIMIVTESVIMEEEKRGEEGGEMERELHHGIGYDSDDYQWSQTSTDILITVNLPPDVKKTDIICNITNTSITIGLTDGTTYLRGELSYNIDKETSTWTYSNGILEVTLEKSLADNTWSSLLQDNTATASLPLSDGLDKDFVSSEELTDIEEKLKEMRRKRSSSGDCSSSVKYSKPVIFTNTLEECDTDDDQDITIYLISTTGSVIQKIPLSGRQLLFTVPPSTSSSSLLAIRHDVDAILYSPSLHYPPSTPPLLSFTHKATFNALAYVQASKRDKKFLLASSDCSHAVVTDTSRHVFIYSQPEGEVKAQTGAQFVYTIEPADVILGLQLTINKLVFVLTDSTLYLLEIPH